MKIYISGKITGLPIEIARIRFKAAGIRINIMGHESVNPMELTPYDENKSWNDYMIDDIKLLFDCDGIYMIDNWKESKGARIEHNIAIETGKVIFYQSSEI